MSHLETAVQKYLYALMKSYVDSFRTQLSGGDGVLLGFARREAGHIPVVFAQIPLSPSGFRRAAPSDIPRTPRAMHSHVQPEVALCLPAYPYKRKRLTDSPSNTNAALACGTCDALHSAEEEGFEPPVRCRTTVFKTAAIDHSAIPPELRCRVQK